MNFAQIFLRFGVLFLALALGVCVMIVAQDTQRLQRKQQATSAEMALAAERLRVLEAEWSYLTRPAYLQQALQKAEPGAQWIPIRGENMARMEDYMGVSAPQVAAAEHPPAQ